MNKDELQNVYMELKSIAYSQMPQSVAGKFKLYIDEGGMFGSASVLLVQDGNRFKPNMEHYSFTGKVSYNSAIKILINLYCKFIMCGFGVELCKLTKIKIMEKVANE